jgi:CRISPR type III-A-associated RAMP protein Csm4
MTQGFLALLRPNGPWRLGPDSGARDRVDRICHSDTLFSAITSAMDLLGTREEWLRAAGDASVRLSSAFPFQGKTLFIAPPRNVWPPAPSARVRWRGARFIPVSLAADLLADKPLDETRWRVDGESECLVPQDRPGPGPMQAALRHSAAVDRLTGNSQHHATACLEFAPGAGMWIAVSFTDDQARLYWTEPVKAALRLLSDSGIGGERSRGWGRFEAPEFREGAFPELLLPPAPEEHEPAWWLLSLFQPSETDSVDWNRGRYLTTMRGGRVESSAGWGVMKKRSRMVAEGSVLVADFPPRGAAADVAPEGFAHPVLRNGMAFALPIAWKAANP